MTEALRLCQECKAPIPPLNSKGEPRKAYCSLSCSGRAAWRRAKANPANKPKRMSPFR